MKVRVAAILNARELAINIGSDGGVVQGMKFAVLAESPTIVTDPMTGDELDQIDREKVRVEAIEVSPKDNHLPHLSCHTNCGWTTFCIWPDGFQGPCRSSAGDPGDITDGRFIVASTSS